MYFVWCVCLCVVEDVCELCVEVVGELVCFVGCVGDEYYG